MTSPNGDSPVAIYARISADPQGRAIGVTDQAQQSRAFIEQHGWEITGPRCECRSCERYDVPADVYCDNDLSASGKKKRPHYDRLLADIKAGHVRAVVVSDADRLHRSPMELEEYINVCEPLKVPTYTIKKGEIDLATSTGRLVARMLGAAARHEWERMVERQLNAKRRNREAGIRVGGSRPFGWQLDGSSGLMPLEPEATAVRDGYSWALAGLGWTTIAARWNKAGLRTPATGRRGGGNPWHASTVKQVLARAHNAGLIDYKGKIIGKARWDGIIDEDTFRTVRAMTAERRSFNPGPKPRWLLTGVLICGTCESRRFAVISPQKGRPHTYTCNAGREQPGLAGRSHVSREVPLLDAYIEQIIVERLGRPDVVAALNTRPEVDIAALDGRRNAINAQLDEWARTPGITPRQLQIKNEPLLAELAEVERQISEALRGDPLPEFAGRDPAKVWAELKDAGNIERMRAIVALLLRVKLHTVKGRKMPAGWRVGMARPFFEDAIEILPPHE